LCIGSEPHTSHLTPHASRPSNYYKLYIFYNLQVNSEKFIEIERIGSITSVTIKDKEITANTYNMLL